MRNAPRLAAIALSIVAASVLLAGLASTLALSRSAGNLNANLASLISADSPIDLTHTRFAPLDQEIIDEARSDGAALATLEHNNGGSNGATGGTPGGASTPTPRPSSGGTSSNTPTATATPRTTPTPTFTLP